MEPSEKAKNTTVNDQVKKFIGDTKFYKQENGDHDGQIVIRTGEAEEIFYPVRVDLSGVITAPGKFYAKRKELHSPEKCHVLYDKLKGIIKLVVDEQNSESGYSVVGKLEGNPDILDFGINHEGKPTKKFDPKDLMEKLKFLRVFFVDKNENNNIVTALQNFKVKVTSSYENIDNQRGNARRLMDSQLEHGFKESFTVKMPIFKGLPEQSFKIDILCEVRDGGVSVWHESRELMELQKQILTTKIDEELQAFDEIVCIEQ